MFLQKRGLFQLFNATDPTRDLNKQVEWNNRRDGLQYHAEIFKFEKE